MKDGEEGRIGRVTGTGRRRANAEAVGVPGDANVISFREGETV